MIDKKVWFTIGTGRATGVDVAATQEPSHIHIPRPSRVARPHDGNRASRGAHVIDEEYRGATARRAERRAA